MLHTTGTGSETIGYTAKDKCFLHKLSWKDNNVDSDPQHPKHRKLQMLK